MPNKSWKLNKATFSPFRAERTESFIIGNKLGNLTFIDFGDTSLRGNCFEFVKLLFNAPNIYEALKIIDRDFGLGIVDKKIITEDYKQIVAEYQQPIDIPKTYSIIQCVTRKFTNEELEYWNQYHQSIDDLKANNIYSIKNVYMNKEKFILKETDLRFGYLYGDKWKIYRPFADKKTKWMPNNVPITAMDGLNDVINCDRLFINKSKKDYMVMKKIFPCSCAVQNEGIACFSQENVDFLKANSREQILSFDSDVTGVKNSQQITKLFDFGYCNVPKIYLKEGIKDWADLARAHGMQTIEKYLKQEKFI
tara:strand:- start:273 stop:1196 length:924 start_codon:yes stop_codon:yes gene_type:complete